jgi:hypothetical protein
LEKPGGVGVCKHYFLFQCGQSSNDRINVLSIVLAKPIKEIITNLGPELRKITRTREESCLIGIWKLENLEFNSEKAALKLQGKFKPSSRFFWWFFSLMTRSVRKNPLENEGGIA